MKIRNINVKTFRTGKDKRPLTKNGFKDATFDFIPKAGESFGVATGEILDENNKPKYLVVVDVDMKGQGETSWDIIRYLIVSDKDADTYTVRTQSGGLHYYYTVDILAPFPATVKKNIDIKYVGGYVIGAGSVGEKGNYEVINDTDIEPFPDKFYTFIQNAVKNKENNQDFDFGYYTYNDYDKEMTIEGLLKNPEKWDEESYRPRFTICSSFKRLGFSFEEFLSVMDISATGKEERDWRSSWTSTVGVAQAVDYKSLFKYSKYIPEGIIEAETTDISDLSHPKNIYRVNNKALKKSYKMFNNLRKVRFGGKQLVMDLTLATEDDYDYDVFRYEEGKRHYTEKKFLLDYVGLKNNKHEIIQKNAFDIWFENPPVSYIGLKYDAELPYGTVEVNGAKVFNDYKKPVLKDGEGTYDLFFQHIEEVVCDGNIVVADFVKKWIYHMMKYPNAKNGVALAMRGEPGTGKTTMYQILKGVFDKRFTTTINKAEDFSNRFNAKYASCYLVSLEEAVFAGTRKTGVWSILKDVLTNDKIQLEKKGVDAIDIDNHLHIMITTNHDWAAPKEEGDRRYLVLSVNDSKKGDREYFKDLYWNMENGGLKKLYDYAVNESGITENDEDWTIPETLAGTEDMLKTISKTKRGLMRLYWEYKEDRNSVKHIFEHTDSGMLVIRPANLYELYRNSGVGIDRGRKEAAEIFEGQRRKITITTGGDSVRGYVFNDIEDYRNVMIKNGFKGQDVFKADEEETIDDGEDIVLNTVEGILYKFQKADKYTL